MLLLPLRSAAPAPSPMAMFPPPGGEDREGRVPHGGVAVLGRDGGEGRHPHGRVAQPRGDRGGGRRAHGRVPDAGREVAEGGVADPHVLRGRGADLTCPLSQEDVVRPDADEGRVVLVHHDGARAGLAEGGLDDLEVHVPHREIPVAVPRDDGVGRFVGRRRGGGVRHQPRGREHLERAVVDTSRTGETGVTGRAARADRSRWSWGALGSGRSLGSRRSLRTGWSRLALRTLGTLRARRTLRTLRSLRALRTRGTLRTLRTGRSRLALRTRLPRDPFQVPRELDVRIREARGRESRRPDPVDRPGSRDKACAKRVRRFLSRCVGRQGEKQHDADQERGSAPPGLRQLHCSRPPRWGDEECALWRGGVHGASHEKARNLRRTPPDSQGIRGGFANETGKTHPSEPLGESTGCRCHEIGRMRWP